MLDFCELAEPFHTSDRLEVVAMAILNFPAKRRLLCCLSLLAVTWVMFSFFIATGEDYLSRPSSSSSLCDHGHHNHGHHDHGERNPDERIHYRGQFRTRMLPEELAEEEDLAQEGFGLHYHDHDNHNDHDNHRHFQSDDGYTNDMSPIGLWIRAMGCSLIVSMASLICLIILPLIFYDGKPSRAVVDCLAVFGAGAMLGDAFLHQLPHAFGGKLSHSQNHIGSFDDADHAHGHSHNHIGSFNDADHAHGHSHAHSHAHSLDDLSIGLFVLFGIVLFFLVEKIVRYVEGHSVKGANYHTHGHHYHKLQSNLNDDGVDATQKFSVSKDPKQLDVSSEKELNGQSNARLKKGQHVKPNNLRKRSTTSAVTSDSEDDIDSKTVFARSSSNLVFGYLNLFSDGVHNFTDGMALGSAFLLHGSVGGWSRTLFLLAHELPQEVGDFGILVRSGFSVSKALFFNFLSALVALAGTALALVLGKDPGQSSFIEGFTAGGFIYIAVAGVLPDMQDQETTIRRTFTQLASLLSGMALALCISIAE